LNLTTDRLINSNWNFKASSCLHFQGPAIKEGATVWPCKRKRCFRKLKALNYNSIVHSKKRDSNNNWQTFQPVVKIMSVYFCLITINGILSSPSKAFHVFACNHLGFVLWGFNSYQMFRSTVGWIVPNDKMWHPRRF